MKQGETVKQLGHGLACNIVKSGHHDTQPVREIGSALG